MDSPCKGRVLLVGDGDFSFTLSLLKNSALEPSQITASNLEAFESIQHHQLAVACMQELKDMGVQVLLETDARELHTHPQISKEQYQRVIFNFPLADRHNIKKNRALLADFFSSCSHILCDDGQVMVTLCKGQGGTPADQPRRSWHDSWQIGSMASNSGFIITNILPFQASKYPEYHSVGFRFQDKSFNTEGALTHLFEKADPVTEQDSFCPRGSVVSNRSCYSCPHYIAEKMKRNLLQEQSNPLNLLRERLETSLVLDFETNVIVDQISKIILPGHKSGVVVSSDDGATNKSNSCDDKDGISNDDDDDADVPESVDVLERIKDKKNKANLSRMTQQNSKASFLLHNIDSVSSQHTKVPAAQPVAGVATDFQTYQRHLSRMFPTSSESVFTLVKSNGSQSNVEMGIVEEEARPFSASDAERKASQNGSKPCSTRINSDNTQYCNTELKIPGNLGPSADFSDRIFHCRVSMLENFPEMRFVDCTDAEDLTTFENVGIVSESASQDTPVQKAGFIQSERTNSPAEQEQNLSQKRNECFVVSGPCFLPRSIEADTLPVRHELMLVIKLGNHNSCSEAAAKQINTMHVQNKHHITNNTNTSLAGHYDSAYRHACEIILDCLHRTKLFTATSLGVHDIGNFPGMIGLDGCDSVSDVKFINLESSPQDKNTAHSEVFAGLFLKVAKKTQHFCVLILHLDNIACKICNIKDPRLLWTSNTKFTRQFQSGIFPQTFSPFSLYPMKFTHDLSFWENPACSDFDIDELFNIIHYVARDLVVNVSLIDLYTDPNTGQKSRCYRLSFMSQELAFPYLVSWKLQSQIRMELAHKLGVTLR